MIRVQKREGASIAVGLPDNDQGVSTLPAEVDGLSKGMLLKVGPVLMIRLLRLYLRRRQYLKL